MKIDLLDRKIIYQLDLDARQSASAIGKKLKVPKETVNFRIKRLLKNDIIKGFYALLNNSLINRYFFKIFIKFKEIHPDKKKSILDFLADYGGMSQVLLLEGKFDVQLFFLVQDNNDLMKFMENVNKFCGKEIQEKQILIVDSIYRYNLKVLYDGGEDVIRTVESKRSEYQFQPIDWQVLKEITKDARISVLEIAKNIGISAQLAQYHLKKLVKDKVIVSSNISINYDKLDKQHYHLTFQVNDHCVLPKIIEFCNQSKKSIFATTMVGSYDGSAEVIVTNNEELRKFIDNLLVNFAESINILDVLMIYKEYELRLYPI